MKRITGGGLERHGSIPRVVKDVVKRVKRTDGWFIEMRQGRLPVVTGEHPAHLSDGIKSGRRSLVAAFVAGSGQGEEPHLAAVGVEAIDLQVLGRDVFLEC